MLLLYICISKLFHIKKIMLIFIRSIDFMWTNYRQKMSCLMIKIDIFSPWLLEIDVKKKTLFYYFFSF